MNYIRIIVRWIRKTKNNLIDIVSPILLNGHYTCGTVCIKNLRQIHYDLSNNISYYDEGQEEIREQFGLSELEDVPCKMAIANDNIVIRCQKTDGENWCILQMGFLPANYVLEFDYYPKNVIKEVQLAINFKNMKNRNRFLILNNTIVMFDLIKHSHFYPASYIKELGDVFLLGEKNHIRLFNINRIYKLEVNGINLCCIKEKNKLVNGKDVAIILWEDKNNRPIDCTITNVALWDAS